MYVKSVNPKTSQKYGNHSCSLKKNKIYIKFSFNAMYHLGELCVPSMVNVPQFKNHWGKE